MMHVGMAPLAAAQRSLAYDHTPHYCLEAHRLGRDDVALAAVNGLEADDRV